jgi:hypothetical protein
VPSGSAQSTVTTQPPWARRLSPDQPHRVHCHETPSREEESGFLGLGKPADPPLLRKVASLNCTSSPQGGEMQEPEPNSQEQREQHTAHFLYADPGQGHGCAPTSLRGRVPPWRLWPHPVPSLLDNALAQGSALGAVIPWSLATPFQERYMFIWPSSVQSYLNPWQK